MGRSSVLVIPEVRWSVAPIPKVASTLLKRLAVIASGRKPQESAALGETRPALAIHRADVHQLPALSQLPQQEQEQLLADSHGLRLAVTRHPGERLLSFWHDKLHLADPAYAPLNASVQTAHGHETSDPCTFSEFLAFLSDHWQLLQSDGHLLPQQQWLATGMPPALKPWMTAVRVIAAAPKKRKWRRMLTTKSRPTTTSGTRMTRRA